MIEDFRDITVGDLRLRVMHLSARKAVHVQVKLASVLGEAIVTALSTIDGKKIASAKKDPTAFLSSIGNEITGLFKGLASRLDTETMDFLIDAIFEKIVIPSKPPMPLTIDHFEGNPLDLWKVLLEGLKFNFAPFIVGFQQLSNDVTSKEALSQSQPAAT